MNGISPNLIAAVLGRNVSLFSSAIESSHTELKEAIGKRRVLVIGAAGSIGAAFVTQICEYSPEALHLVDINENGLVEVVRDLRSSNQTPPKDFQTFSIGLGGLEFKAFLTGEFNYDTVVNFAALKHVRSERDPYSMLRMLNTNVVYLDDMLSTISSNSVVKRIFSVSSDKSVNPASAMGSSKALMEDVLWLHSDRFISSSARFANVAFSAGSLLESFLVRLNKRQPLSAPSDVKRFFISHEEAGQLCLIGAFLGYNRETVFPGLSPQSDMLTFSMIATTVLNHFGYEPLYCDTDLQAREVALSLTPKSKQWPVRFSTSDTSGEKMFEEFHSDDDEINLNRWNNIGVLQIPELSQERISKLHEGLNSLRKISDSGVIEKAELLSVLKQLVPDLHHVETGTNLDGKM